MTTRTHTHVVEITHTPHAGREITGGRAARARHSTTQPYERRTCRRWLSTFTMTLAGLVLGCAVLAGGGGSARGDVVRVYDWNYFTQGASHSKGLYNDNNFTDQGDIPADRNHHFGFTYNDGSVEVVCGSANNNNRNIQSIAGSYIDMSFGQKPTGMINIHDATEDGIGDYNTVTGAFTPDLNDDIYIAGNVFGGTQGTELANGSHVKGIELDGVLNDISALPAWPDATTSDVELPAINVVPEPATLALFGLGGLGLLARRRRRGKGRWVGAGDYRR